MTATGENYSLDCCKVIDETLMCHDTHAFSRHLVVYSANWSDQNNSIDAKLGNERKLQ
jgi:hypothetical protein